MGWASGVGDAAAVAALALAATTLAALVRPRLADRMPLLRIAFLTAYLGVAAAALLRDHYAFDGRLNHVRYPWAYGAYLGLAACAVAVIAAAVFSGRSLPPRRATEAVGWAVGLGLLISLLLPWHRLPYNVSLTHGATFTTLGLPLPSAVLAAALVVLGGTRRRGQALCWIGAGVFTFGAFGFGEASPGRAYGFWLALGFAVALLSVGSVVLREWPRLARPESTDALLVAAAAVFVVSLFLPWQRLCTPPGLCFSGTGWTLPGSSAAVLAALVAVAVLLRSHVSRIVELTAAVRLLPVAASIALIAGVVLPWWGVLPSYWAFEDTVFRGWFTAAD